jgi:hypothetical protein
MSSIAAAVHERSSASASGRHFDANADLFGTWR